MFVNPFLRELEYLFREADNPAHSILFGDDTSSDWFDRFRAVTALKFGSADRKKLAEANRLLLFGMHHENFPDGEILAGENPDFTITQPHRKFGIELRDIYVDLPGRAPMQWQERLKDRIVERARELYANAGGPPVRVIFSFANTDYRESEIEGLAQDLSKCVPLSLASSTEDTILGHREGGNCWLSGLMSIVGRAPQWWERDDPPWNASHGGTVYASKDFLQAAIDRKESRLNDYRKSACDEFWLLLVVPGFAASSSLRPPDASYSFKSSFDRVFWFQLQDMEIVELKCARA
jgi:hypothetical protein